MNFKVYDKLYNRFEIAKDSKNAYLFGDNLADKIIGYVPSKTQAVIRGLPNAFGLSTKKDRFKSVNSYLSDEDYKLILSDWELALSKAKAYIAITGGVIYVPKDGIGTGMARLSEFAPKLYQKLFELGVNAHLLD